MQYKSFSYSLRWPHWLTGGCMSCLYVICLHVLLLAGYFFSGQAHAASQILTLEPGWNAIYINIDPLEDDLDTVFNGVPIESIWSPSSSGNTFEYISIPNENLPKLESWLRYFPEGSDERSLTNLFALQANRGYLVKVNSSQTQNVVIEGAPVLNAIAWQQGAYNLTGFAVQPGNQPTFASYFQGTLNTVGQEIYTLVNGEWQLIANPASTMIEPGKAYWILSQGTSDFTGPVAVTFDGSSDLSFAKGTLERTVELTNNSDVEREVSLTYSGLGVLTYWNFVPENDVAEWAELPLTLTLAAGEKREVRLAPRRSMVESAAQPVVDTNNIETQPSLSIMEAGGQMEQVEFEINSFPDYSGLWVGFVEVNAVSQPLVDPTTTLPVASPFTYRIIFHVDSSMTPRHLSNVVQLWEEGTVNATGEVEVPGRFVLVTDPEKYSQYSGATLRDGEEVGRRVSTAAFGFKEPIVCSGAFDSNGVVNATISLNPTDNSNPFYHLYHPDHNTADKSYTITRELEFTMSPTNPSGLDSIAYGYNELSGDYKEVIQGLHKDPLLTSGRFFIRKVSDESSLQ
jgi:hypothetical protein